MRRFTGSLRARLLLSGLAGIVVAAVAVAELLGAAFAATTLETFDNRLRDDLFTLAGQVTSDAGGTIRLRSEPPDTRYARVFSGHYWMVWQQDRTFRSRSLWDANLPKPGVETPPVSGPAIEYRTIDGPLEQTLRSAYQTLRIAGVDRPVHVLVASDVGQVLRQIARFRVMAGLAGAVVAAALMLVVAVQAGFALRPLSHITRALELLRRGDRQRLDVERFPNEIRPLAEELNTLLIDYEQMASRARSGASDLAHGLKTPLAVLLAASDRRSSDLPDVVQEQVERIRTSIDRHLAVASPADRHSRTLLAPVVSAMLEMFSRMHAGRALAFDADIDERLEFRGGRADLEEMLGNLLDNACKWAHSRISLSATHHEGQILLRVTDDGPGVPDQELERIVRRGVRLDEQMPGSGLGLSIVSAVAESYGGRLSVERAPSGGLCATLLLPGTIRG